MAFYSSTLVYLCRLAYFGEVVKELQNFRHLSISTEIIYSFLFFYHHKFHLFCSFFSFAIHNLHEWRHCRFKGVLKCNCQCTLMLSEFTQWCSMSLVFLVKIHICHIIWSGICNNSAGPQNAMETHSSSCSICDQSRKGEDDDGYILLFYLEKI